MEYDDLISIGIAFGLGLLVGMQREKVNHEMAGVRTFTLVALLGSIVGILSRDYSNPFLLPGVALAITGLMVVSNYMKSRKEDNPTIGLTTEMSLLLIFILCAYLVEGNKVIGVMVGGSIAILLFVKESLHGFIDQLKDKDLTAIMTFAGISLIILPILPDQDFGPYSVLNPREIWWMVTLIVGLSVLGYFIYKWVGKTAGMISNGILGGIISSTATTVSYARRTAENPSISKISFFVIVAGITVSIIRVIVEIAIVVSQKLSELILPFALLFGFMTILSVIVFYLTARGNQEDEMPEPKNPAQFKSALIFGILYTVILLAVAFSEEKLGDKGLYLVSIIGGFGNKDAITLSFAQSIRGGMDTQLGWRLIMAGVLSSFAFKVVLAAVLGSRKLTLWIGITMAISIAFGLLLIFFWPD